ncbi:MAG: hypothetical protein WCE51_11885 [Chthoniobacterales bacterium]
MIILRYSLALMSIFALLGANTGRGDNVLPSHFNFNRYSAMLDHSPFAIATAVALPAATPDFAKDLYVANAARSPDGDMVTVASTSDQKFKKYLTTTEPMDGYDLVSIEWSDRVGATKVTISKDGKFATLTFNEALLAQRGSPTAPPAPGHIPPAVPLARPSGKTQAAATRVPDRIQPKPDSTYLLNLKLHQINSYQQQQRQRNEKLRKPDSN